MTSHWQQVPLEQARRHPLYGVGGWLMFFAVGLVLGLLKELGAVNGEAYKAGMTLRDLFSVDHPAIAYLKLAIGLHTFIVVVICWLMFSKHPSFRKVTTALLLGGWPAAALLGGLRSFPGLGDGLALGFLSWTLSCAVWVTYLQRSRRIRVTFEHQVRSDAVGTLGKPAGSVPSQASGTAPTMHSKQVPSSAEGERLSSITPSSR